MLARDAFVLKQEFAVRSAPDDDRALANRKDSIPSIMTESKTADDAIVALQSILSRAVVQGPGI
jgi:hypothetical protein